MEASRCWCGGALDEAIGPHYRRCLRCGAAVLATLPGEEHFDVTNDERDFCGKAYWTEYSRARNFPDIKERASSDLSERCLFWLERLIEVVHPPGRALELGCGHGGFVRLMQELGFDATGTELSPWVVDFARQTFSIPVVQGRLETLDLEPGFKCIAAFDVLEHLEDPLGTIGRCAELLAPDGVLLLQTPWYRGEGPGWSMFQKDEHIYLFTERSVISHRGSADERLGWPRGPCDRAGEAARRLQPTVEDPLFLCGGPSLRADRFTRQIDDRAGAFKLRRPGGAAVSRGPGDQPPRRAAGASRHAARQNHDLMAVGGQGVRQWPAEETGSAGDDNFHIVPSHPATPDTA